MRPDLAAYTDVPQFARRFFGARERFTRIGSGPVGGKAAGLLFMRHVIETLTPPRDVDIDIPTLTVIGTDEFAMFVEANRLEHLATSDVADDRIALAFQKGELSAELVGDLRALVEQVQTPLAIRSSSLLEDALTKPFAGIYATKMIPNYRLDADSRFRRLVEAIKLVYASTFFADAKAYRRAIGCDPGADRMAVIIQEVVGRRHGIRFYPDVSGVARSFSFYHPARTRPEDGVVSLALGLGRTIVDEGIAWSYSPALPAAPPPYSSPSEIADNTQTSFWAVNMGPPPDYDPIRETEYMVRVGLDAAQDDGTLSRVVSSFDPAQDRLTPGLSGRGIPVVTFAPILALRQWAVNDAATSVLEAARHALGMPVEIEFAITFDDERERARLGFLQVRPMVLVAETVDLPESELERADALVASTAVLGNGTIDTIGDIIYVRPETFEARHTRAIAADISRMNATLTDAHRPYLLIGFGRWGTSDSWLGIPIAWPDVAGARAIVEASLPGFVVEPSQGSHFFHNISSAGVPHFSVSESRGRIDWEWLRRQPSATESPLVRHVRVEHALRVRVDGRSGHGVVLR